MAEPIYHYRHKQQGTALLIVLALCGIFLIVATHEHIVVMNLSLALLIIIATLFSSLTIYLTHDKIGWHFGLKFWHKTIPLSDITSARLITTKWYYGLGIRLVPSGWLYIVSGNHAIELTRLSGEKITIGTNDGKHLLKQLKKHHIKVK
ncbi:hypothetical protein LP316_12295 [Thalassotalea sp. LPB0316]|uniref:hypothetical protein n=1 Tax=Thalassotalea sp. LPB0316 TaxID=2769490 RepID=UPI001867F329|nr:hypothetical protein [Thalassotalea sp. LPB0316]QOL25076.1 hypothetical protein LP316_12295 [Thalassotalea sp. LPB0316]